MRIDKQGTRFVCICTFAEKEIPKAAGFRWDPGTRYWWTPDADKAAKLANPELAKQLMEEHAAKQSLRKELVDDSRQADAAIDLPCPEDLAYLPYQRAGIASALRRQNVLFGDEMGLGKTIQAIGMINTDSTLNKILIVCPATLKRNWYRELRKWLTRDLLIGFGEAKYFHPEAAAVTIINYDVLHKHVARLRTISWDLIICDEAHLLKNPKAKRTRAICGVDDYTARKEGCEVVEPLKARLKCFLTGTPIPNRPIEGFPLFHYLAPEEFRSFFGFAKRYCSAGDNGFGFDPSGASNLPELQEKLRATIMIRRLKADVLTELPAKRRSIIEIPANGASGAVEAEKEAFAAHEDRLAALRVAVELAKASDRIEDYQNAVGALKAAAQVAFTEISRLRHETAVAKIPYVVEHIRDVVEAGSKVVVFAHHHDVIRAIASAFKEQAVTLYGETAMDARQAAVDRFQTDPECLVFVGGILAAGVGITLTAASHVVFAELDWVPGNVTQAEDRCMLAGQKVLTPVGWRKIEEIQVGDLVIGGSGKPRRVTAAWSRGALAPDLIAEITLEGWLEPIKCTGDHKIMTPDGYVEAQKLRPGSRVALPAATGARIDAIAFPAECRCAPNGRLRRAPDVVALNEEALYAFGFFVGNGWIAGDHSQIGFASHRKNRPRLVRIAAWFASLGFSATWDEPERDNGSSIYVNSAEMSRLFLHLIGTGFASKRLPTEWLDLDQEQSRWLLRGLMESDGYERKGRHEYVSASEGIVAQVAMVIRKAGYRPCVTYADVATSHVAAYSDSSESNPASALVREVRLRFPRKIDGHRERVHDITVEEDHSFVAGIGVVSNCHRIGQRDCVLVQHLVLEGSLDARMAEVLVEKQEIQAAALDTVAEPAQDSPALPSKDRAATESASRKEIEAQAASLTPEQVAAAHHGLKLLAAMDGDRARDLNGMGFSRLDTEIGNRLAACGSLTPKQAALAARLVTKYRRQVPECAALLAS